MSCSSFLIHTNALISEDVHLKDRNELNEEDHQSVSSLGGRKIPSTVISRKIILVTGGCGFIGSNFINFWAKYHPNDYIVNYDCLLIQSNRKNIENPGNVNYHFVLGNLTDRALLDSLFAKYHFTHVIHFAAASNVDQSFSCPVACTVSNVLGTHTLLESSRSYGHLCLFLHISTDEVYGEVAEGTCCESSSPFCPTNPYAASKAGAECLVIAYGKSFNLPHIITRSNNVYGKYQYPLQAIPRFVTCLLEGRPMPVHGDGLNSRTFIHTSDKCAALEIILEKGTTGEIYNIGTENEITVIELCKTLLQKVTGEVTNMDQWIAKVPDRCYNDCRYSVDTSKLRALGWTPKIQFGIGLDETIQWYKDNRTHWENTAEKNILC